MSIDPRLLQLSYSSRTILHRCPRKYQLSKLAKRDREASQSVTFAFGHAVGTGIQSVLEGKSWNQVVLDMILAWDYPDLLAEEDKNNKSIFFAIYAVQIFQSMRNSGKLKDYELAYFQGKPAVELSFRISLPDGFKYRGHVDVVLRHKVTGRFLVLELKTTNSNYVNEASYKNSSQALGYSIILDAIAPDASDYEVFYLVYMTKQTAFADPMIFKKSYSDRAFWIKELMMDIQRISYYEQEECYPSYGESCMDFGRECEFFSNCSMSTYLLAIPYDEDIMADEVEYTLELSLLDLIDAQLNREHITI